MDGTNIQKYTTRAESKASQYRAPTSVLLGRIREVLITFVTLGRAYNNMHRDHTSWNFPYWDSRLSKSFVILKYPSSIDELHVIESFWNNVFVLRPPSEDELLERGDGGGGVVLVGPDVRAVEQAELHLDRLFPAGHLPPGRIAPRRKIPTTAGSVDGGWPGGGIQGRKEKAGESGAARARTDADPTKDRIRFLVLLSKNLEIGRAHV